MILLLLKLAAIHGTNEPHTITLFLIAAVIVGYMIAALKKLKF